MGIPDFYRKIGGLLASHKFLIRKSVVEPLAVSLDGNTVSRKVWQGVESSCSTWVWLAMVKRATRNESLPIPRLCQVAHPMGESGVIALNARRPWSPRGWPPRGSCPICRAPPRCAYRAETQSSHVVGWGVEMLDRFDADQMPCPLTEWTVHADPGLVAVAKASFGSPTVYSGRC